MKVKGLHHLTAITSKIQQNYDFYTRTLGMRLVKRSVNQDDVSAYHLFYADGAGSPGTDLTFFDWSLPSENRGTHSIVRTGLRVSGSALGFWDQYLREKGIASGQIHEEAGRGVLEFQDPEGQRLALVDDGGTGDTPVPWEDSPIDPAHQIRGLGPITVSVPSVNATAAALTEVLGLSELGEYRSEGGSGNPIHIFGHPDAGPYSEIHVRVDPGLSPSSPGAGAVHHVAFRVADDDYEAWANRLNQLGIHNSGPVDRYYFRSLYFREPNGILFELATDGPGFAVDEDRNTLGEKVILPPFLEPRREAIVANLKPIT